MGWREREPGRGGAPLDRKGGSVAVHAPLGGSGAPNRGNRVRYTDRVPPSVRGAVEFAMTASVIPSGASTP